MGFNLSHHPQHPEFHVQQLHTFGSQVMLVVMVMLPPSSLIGFWRCVSGAQTLSARTHSPNTTCSRPLWKAISQTNPKKAMETRNTKRRGHGREGVQWMARTFGHSGKLVLRPMRCWAVCVVYGTER